MTYESIGPAFEQFRGRVRGERRRERSAHNKRERAPEQPESESVERDGDCPALHRYPGSPDDRGNLQRRRKGSADLNDFHASSFTRWFAKVLPHSPGEADETSRKKNT